VSQRTREIGIRNALGATPGDIVAFVIGLGMRPVVVGACVGTAAALALARVIEANLFETPPADPTVFVTVIGILLAAAAAAASVPAWRATRIDPATTLRAD
jgi:ABC-type antimicrobial peptide transport system permease subunit